MIKHNILYDNFKLHLLNLFYKISSLFNDNEKELIFMHVEKCGGGTLRNSLKKSKIINKTFNKFTNLHIVKPPIKKKAKCVILIRNPIKRSISAYNYQSMFMKKKKDLLRFNNKEFNVLLNTYG